MAKKRDPIESDDLDPEPVDPLPDPSSALAPPVVVASALAANTVFVEQDPSGGVLMAPLVVPIDAGSKAGDRTVNIGGIRHEHVSETSDGSWVYRKG